MAWFRKGSGSGYRYGTHHVKIRIRIKMFRICGKNVPDPRQNVPDTRQNVPDPRQTVPDPRQTVPDPRQNVPDPQR